MKVESVKFEEVAVGKGWGVSVCVGGEPLLVLVTQAKFGIEMATALVMDLERSVDGVVIVSGKKAESVK